jgi:histidyl-tRNA synthetase
VPERSKGRPRKIERVRGTQDFLPEESARWHAAEERIREIFALYNFGEIHTPVIEPVEVFRRPLGAGSDAVVKEMYEFKDKGGRDLALRPEGTASVVRAYIEHGLYAKGSRCKLFYICPIFRYDRPQAGRYRQHHQAGVEVFGDLSSALDAEVIGLGRDILSALEVSKDSYEIRRNSSGCPRCRPAYIQELRKFLESRKAKLCKDCSGYRFDNSPMRVLDCKEEFCRKLTEDAPVIGDRLCEDCTNHLLSVTSFLEKTGIASIRDKRLVRGLDYYTRTCFEFVKRDGGAQGTLIGGGRYDGLVELMGGPATPGVGWGMGLERVLAESGLQVPKAKLEYYVVAASKEARADAIEVCAWIRESRRACEAGQEGKSFNGQMRAANASGAQYAVLVGLTEAGPGQVALKDLRTGKQEMLPKDDLFSRLRQKR